METSQELQQLAEALAKAQAELSPVQIGRASCRESV